MCIVSVIIPNYNHALYLEQRINSVLNQNYQNFEVIILDDCSTDDSRKVIEHYRVHPKVKHIVYNKENTGSTFCQWRNGIKLAKGEFIWFAESDDYAHPDFLVTLINFISEDRVGLVFCDSQIVDENNINVGNTRTWFSSIHHAGEILDNSRIVNGLDFCINHLFYKNLIPNASAVLFRKSAVDKRLHLIDTKLKYCGDWKLWINILLEFDLAYVNCNLNYFRKHSCNVTNSLLRMKLENITILKELALSVKGDREKYNLYKSLFTWSFNPAIWVHDFQFNHSNFRYYFRKNFSLEGLKYFIIFLADYSRDRFKRI